LTWWLLPAQTLLDLIAEEKTPAQQWIGPIDSSDLRVSVISIAQARAAISRVADADERTALEADLSSFLSQIAADSGREPLPFLAQHASVWQALVHLPQIQAEPQINRQIYASAMYEGMTVVEAGKPSTPDWRAIGVSIEVI